LAEEGICVDASCFSVSIQRQSVESWEVSGRSCKRYFGISDTLLSNLCLDAVKFHTPIIFYTIHVIPNTHQLKTEWEADKGYHSVELDKMLWKTFAKLHYLLLTT
jgi:hypothetical protein